MSQDFKNKELVDSLQVFKQKDVECLTKEQAYDGFMSVHKIQLKHRLFEGDWSSPLSRELLIRKDAVAVLLYDPNIDAVVMVEQFRVGALQDPQTPWMLELVAGLIDTNETPEEIAKRECFEEAGCQVDKLELLFEFYLSPGACSEKVSLYFACVDASEIGGIHGLENEGEDIKVHVISAKKVFELLSCGRINNAIGLIGLQWLQLNRPHIRSTNK
jgi:ADP-ribose pyrophosphatase